MFLTDREIAEYKEIKRTILNVISKISADDTVVLKGLRQALQELEASHTERTIKHAEKIT